VTLTTSENVRYYDCPDGLDLQAGHRIDEIRYINNATREDYQITGWTVDIYQNKIDMGSWYSESKSLTVFFTKPHEDYSNDSDTITVPEKDEELLIRFVRAQFFLLMSKEDFDNFGDLIPSKWTRGKISKDFSSSRKNMFELYQKEMESWRKDIAQHGFLFSRRDNDILHNINEWIPPIDFQSQTC